MLETLCGERAVHYLTIWKSQWFCMMVSFKGLFQMTEESK